MLKIPFTTMPSDNSVFMVPNFLVLRYLLVKKYQFDLKKGYRSSIWRKFILKPLPIDNPPNPLRIDRYENTACLSVLFPDIPSHCHNDITLCARILLCNVSDTKNYRILILTARVGVLAVGCHQPWSLLILFPRYCVTGLAIAITCHSIDPPQYQPASRL